MKAFTLSISFIVLLFIGGFFFFDKSGDKIVLDDKLSQGKLVQLEDEEEEMMRDVVLAVIKTKKGDIELELYPKIAPETVENFVKLARDGFYYNTKFHRVIPGFMIQGGDPLSKTDSPNVGTGGPGYTFKDEINPRALGMTDTEIAQLESSGYKYDYTLESLPVNVGFLAMANSGPNTNGSQFFIVTHKDQPHLNGRHTVFGKVVGGMGVVLAIEQGDVISGIVIE